MFRNKGFAIPIVIIFIGIFLAIPIVYWFISEEKNDSQIMGSSVSGNLSDGSGLVIEVSSKNGTWDLFYYLCETENECVFDITAGKKQTTFHGGTVTNHKIVIEKGDEWQVYEFAKFFIKPSWGSGSSGFKVTSSGEIIGSYTKTLSDGEENIEVVLVPLESVGETLGNSAVFSDY